MLFNISCGSFDHGKYIEKYIVSHFEASASFTETCRSALWREFSANVKRAKHESPRAFWTLSWIVNVIERCHGALFEIPKAVYCTIKYEYYNSGNSNGLVGLIDRFLRALGNGRIITSTSFLFSFLTSWVLFFVNVMGNHNLVESMVSVIDTLPLAD